MRQVRLLVHMKCETEDMPIGTLVTVEKDFYDEIRGYEEKKHTLNVLGPKNQAIWVNHNDVEELTDVDNEPDEGYYDNPDTPRILE